MTSAPPPPSPALARVFDWESRMAWPLFAGSVVMFGLSTALLVDPHLSSGLIALFTAGIVVLWLFFVIDYVVRLMMAHGERALFVRTRAFDLLTLLLPFLRPFLILVYIWRLPRFRHGTGTQQRAGYLLTVVLFALMFVYTASSGVWLAERNAPGATIVNFDDALWWGFTTIATVGYGDFVPVTLLGRLMAIGLMMGGIAVIGVTSATVVSSISERVRTRATHVHNEE